jgi:hypothetical protein
MLRGEGLEPGRSRREDFDPIAEGKRYGLGPEVSAAIWKHVRREATTHNRLCDENLARERFAQLAKRIAERGGQLGPAPFKWTQVDVAASGGSPVGHALADSVPGKTTQLLAHTCGRARVGLSRDPGPTTLLADQADSDICTPEDSRMFFRRYVSGGHAALSRLARAFASHDRYAAVVATIALQEGLKWARHHLGNGIAPDESLRRELAALEGLAEQLLAKVPTNGSFGVPTGAHEPAIAGDLAAAMMSASDHTGGTVDREELPGGSDVARAITAVQTPSSPNRERIHTDSVAADAARAVRALAFTVETLAGQHLLGHELTHAMRAYQGRSRSGDDGIHVSSPGESLEREADAVADRIGDPRAVRPTGRDTSRSRASQSSRAADRQVRSNVDAATHEAIAALAPQLGLNAGAVDVRTDDDAGRRAAAAGASGLMAHGIVYLRPDRYDPTTERGRYLLAHELAHVAQSRLAPGVDGPAGHHAAEAEAAHIGSAWSRGESFAAPTVAAGRRGRGYGRRADGEGEARSAERLRHPHRQRRLRRVLRAPGQNRGQRRCPRRDLAEELLARLPVTDEVLGRPGARGRQGRSLDLDGQP